MARSPLFDVFDPSGSLQDGLAWPPQDDDGLELGAVLPVKRRPQITDLMPEDEKKGLLSRLADIGSSGLGWAGYILDTPGALLRGVLAGKPLSGFGTSEDRVTGRELLREYGLIDSKDNWYNFAGGLGAEFALDPLAWGSFGLKTIVGRGAKTAAGRAAEAAGLLRNVALDAADTPGVTGVRNYMMATTPRQQLRRIADPAARAEAARTLMGQLDRFGAGRAGLDLPMGAFDDIRVPGTNIGFSYNLGPIGDAVAQGMDRLGAATRETPGIGHMRGWMASAFSKPAGEFYDNDLELMNRVQDASRRAFRNTEDELFANRLRQTRLQREALAAQAPEVIPSGPLAGQAIPEHLRSFRNARLRQSMADWVEQSTGGRPPTQFGPTLPSGAFFSPGSGNEIADWVMENVPEFRAVRDEMARLGPEANAAAEAVGLPQAYWQSQHGTGWFPRQMKWWQQSQFPDRPGAANPRQSAWSRAERILGTQDNFGRRRQDAYDLPGGNRTFRALTGNVNPALDSAQLQRDLIAADNVDVRPILDRAFGQLGISNPYQPWIDNVLRSQEYRTASPARRAALLQAANQNVDNMYVQLADLLRSADTQFAGTGTGIFDTDPWQNMTRYAAGQAKNRANAQELLDQMQELAERTPAGHVAGGVNIPLNQAAERFGFDPDSFRQVWQNLTGDDPTNFSINERYADALRTLAPKTQLDMPTSGLLKGVDNFTNMFKVGVLANPAFHTRNLYSGTINNATHGAFNPLDMWAAFRASRGEYGPLSRRLRNAPGFENLTDAERAARFLDLTGATEVTGGTHLDDLAGMPEQRMGGMFLGADDRSVGAQVADSVNDPNRSWLGFLSDMFSMRGVGFTQNAMRENTNPLLVLNDAVGKRVEDTLRGGAFLNQIRKGVDPRQAAAITFLSNVDYRPQNYTGFERGLKRVLPFYSFQKGILPSIATNLVERPAGLQGKLIRAVVRGSEPSEENFVPDHLRKSSAIPLPEGIFGSGSNPELQRYLTKLDLPWENTFNLLTQGVGAGPISTAMDTVRKTGSNLLGQTNPLIKAPIEYITNRQLYSGRQLSDLYSVLERTFGEAGPPLEQALVNFVPFGSKGLGLYRQLTDERLTPGDRILKAAFNQLSGAGLTDIDKDRAKRQAARDMLNSILETTPGVRKYENLTVPPDVLASMPQEQQKLYLLYKIIQAEAAKRARQKKAQAAIDPLELLGVVQNQGSFS